jgi:hypothetical protein
MKALVRKTLQAAILGSALLGASAFAAPPTLGTCTLGDLVGVTVFSCEGFDAGNLVNNSPAAVTGAQAALASLGVLSDGHTIGLGTGGGTMTLTFDHMLSGLSVIGVHIGGGSDSHVAQGTAFYVFDAGAGTYTVQTNFSSLSDGGLYATTPVPEPTTYGMLLAGLGVMGAVLRRRKA